ncbi:MAG TPA: hypothetical protein VGB89_04515 [Bacteroidota bacterium]
MCLSSYLVYLFGFVVAFHILQGDIRKDVKLQLKQTVPDVELVVIPAHENDTHEFQWMKENEFRYRGGLYDIVKTRVTTDTTYYYCINDLQEERLFENLGEEVRKHTQNNKAATSLVKNAGSLGEHFPISFHGSVFSHGTREWLQLTSSRPLSHSTDVLTPPPKLI